VASSILIVPLYIGTFNADQLSEVGGPRYLRSAEVCLACELRQCPVAHFVDEQWSAMLTAGLDQVIS